jgi:site-specific recombinase XerD
MRQHADTLPSTNPDVNLLQHFTIHLRALNRSDKTSETYLDSTKQFLGFIAERGMPPEPANWKRGHIEAFLAYLLDERKLKSSTVNNRYRGLQAFFKWLDEEGDVGENPMRNMKPPKIDENPPDVLRAEDLQKLLAFEKGNAEYDRRDAAILRLFIDTGARLAEIANLTVDDIDPVNQLVTVMGKGKRPRLLPIGNKAQNALNRYLRVRRQNQGRATDALWLGRGGGKNSGPAMTTSGVRQVIRNRSEDAGLGKVYPHQLRHSWAHDQMASGQVSESDLMRLAGWKSRTMLERYAASAAEERAIDAGRRNSLSDRI